MCFYHFLSNELVCSSCKLPSIGFRLSFYQIRSSSAGLLDRCSFESQANLDKHHCIIFFIELNAPVRTCLVSTTQAGPFGSRLLMRRCLQPWKGPLGTEPPSPVWSHKVLSCLNINLDANFWWRNHCIPSMTKTKVYCIVDTPFFRKTISDLVIKIDGCFRPSEVWISPDLLVFL